MEPEEILRNLREINLLFQTLIQKPARRLDYRSRCRRTKAADLGRRRHWAVRRGQTRRR